MKRFIAVLSGLLVLPAFAEVAPVYYDEVIEYTDDIIDAEDDAYQSEQLNQNNGQRTIINRSTSASRAVASGNTGNVSRKNTSSRAVASSPRSASGASRGTVSRTAKTTNVVSRSSNTSRANVRSRNVQSTRPTTARIGTLNNSVIPATNRNVTTTSVSSLDDSGTSLYNANAARVGIANRRSTARLATITPTTPTVITEEDVSSTTSNLNALAELTDYCKAQYAACMDNYCNVLDDNQGRCSCSKNLKKYQNTENALAEATENFQDVIQKIKYIGLTGSQIESLFTETEAEISMKNNSDSSRLKNSLDAIKKKIVDVSTPTSSSFNPTGGVSIDTTGLLNADFTSGFDLNTLLGGMSGSSTSNVSNQRGEQLYKTAVNRCKAAVLNSCTNQGVDANVITNSYDLEIDKQCVAYERSLNEANREMKNNVANATNILQQARLLLTQNKNSYDFRSCVAAIDSCMQDDYVCGSDYELCLDPTGKYLANGEVVKGGVPGVSGGQSKNEYPTTETALASWTSGGMLNLYATWNYNTGMNAWSMGAKENLGDYIDASLATWKSNYNKDQTLTDNMALYLLQKIGYIDSDSKVHGMCADIMKQCQDYTFKGQQSNAKYIPDNEVVRQYLNSTLAKIKVQQDALLADYAEGCRSDVQSCLSTNGYDESNTSSTASKTAVNACAAEITTCMSAGGYQVTDGVRLTLRAMTDWVASLLINCPVNTYLVDDGIGVDDLNNPGTNREAVHCEPCGYPEVVDANGESVYYSTAHNDGMLNIKAGQGGVAVTLERATSSGGQSTICTCPDGFDDYIEMTNGMKTLKCTPSGN